jgi:hypothetical protein
VLEAEAVAVHLDNVNMKYAELPPLTVPVIARVQIDGAGRL